MEVKKSSRVFGPAQAPWGFPGGSEGKVSASNVGDLGSIPGSGRSPGEGNGNLTPVFLPGDSHGQRSLAGYSPWGRKESNMSNFHFFSSMNPH